MTEENNKKKSAFKYIWEGYAYFQAFLDDSILLAFKKLQKTWEEEQKDDRIHKKVWKSVWKAIWDIWAWYYEKYADLKKWDTNMAEDFIDYAVPEVKKRTNHMKIKMDVLWVKRWDLESLRKLKEPRDNEIKKKILDLTNKKW